MRSLTASCAIAAALSCAAPALAQTAPLTNSVSCVYDAMSVEQREMVQALMLSNDEMGGDPVVAAEGSAEIRALLTDASNACIDAYPWTSGKENNAVAYAIFTLLLDGIHPAMTAGGFAWADIDSYVTTNRARLRATAPPSPAMVTALSTHLASLGWSVSDARQREDIESYFTMLLLREYMRQGFASGVFYRESSAWDRHTF